MRLVDPTLHELIPATGAFNVPSRPDVGAFNALVRPDSIRPVYPAGIYEIALWVRLRTLEEMVKALQEASENDPEAGCGCGDESCAKHKLAWMWWYRRGEIRNYNNIDLRGGVHVEVRL
nr:hypothetical protein [Tanacetum cinerariifolium]